MKQICKQFYKYSKFRDHNVIESIKLSFHTDEYTRRWVGRNPNTPIYLLERLSKDEHYMVRAEVGSNQNTPLRILINLSNDPIEQVRSNVAINKNVPLKISRKLSKDHNYSVRYYVAVNEKTPIKTLIKLSRDMEMHIRDTINRNPTYIKYLDNLNKKNNNSKLE